MIKVLLFGSLPLATKVAQLILENNNFKLIGVVVDKEIFSANDPFKDTLSLKDFANKQNIQVFNFDDLEKNFSKYDLDIGLSVRFSKILNKEKINLFRNGIINFHGGLLPEFGGLFSSVHTVLQSSDIGGGTLHFMDEKIDQGKIIKRCEFKIGENSTGDDVFRKTQISLLEGFKEIIPQIINNKFKILEYKKLNSRRRYFDKNSLDGKKVVDMKKLLSGDKQELQRIKAFNSPNHEPSYFLLDDKKIYLKIKND
tara:strand:+ start:219 stop:983 length:765 start_codon:yes stop_codon:yes gene_type:complete